MEKNILLSEIRGQHLKKLFNVRELSGAFGDIGTDFPLLIAMILASGLPSYSVLIMFGLMQILTGLAYRMPMPVQPLKAMAPLVIAQNIGGDILLGAGLAIGIVMAVLTLTGALDKLGKFIPKAVIRGIQLGLGLSLCLLSFQKYILTGAFEGYILAGIAFLIILLLIDKKKFPTAFMVIVLGVIYTLTVHVELNVFQKSFGVHLPSPHLPKLEDILTGFFLLTLPQIPLSLGNSIFATRQVSEDLFPDKKPLSIQKIGLSYSLMNLINPFLSGLPVCHGSGGMVGHYVFGGRTGGSVIIYGLFYITLGLFFGNGFEQIIQIFPLPILGVILVFEGLALVSLVKDLIIDKRNFLIALLVGILAVGLPYGFVISMVIGVALYYSPLKLNALTQIGEAE
jgi:hypothetical protein